MNDINTPLLKVYFNALSGLPYPVYEGEEPDDLTDQVYIVISDVNSTEASTKNTSDTSSSIQIAIHTWEEKYNTSLSVNTAAGLVFAAIKPTSNSVLDMTADNMQMLNLRVTNDRVDRLVELAGRKYISRYIIFQQDIFIK